MLATFITFEEWKQRFPKLTGKYLPCNTCDGEGLRWNDSLEDWWECPVCEGEGMICQDHVLYNEHIRLTKHKLQAWIEGKPIKAGPLFRRLEIVHDIDWSDIMREPVPA